MQRALGMKVVVVGTGYVGSVTGACLAYLGHSVTCIDTDQKKIAALQADQPACYEPHLVELLALAKDRGGIEFTTEMDAVSGSDVIFIAVGTPPLPTGGADLAYLESAARSIGSKLDPSRYRVIVNKSTVPVGCGNLVETLVREGILEAGRHQPANIPFGVASNPEFLREGSAVSDSLYPDRIVLGAEERTALDLLHELYRPLVEQKFAAPAGIPRPAHRGQVAVVFTTLASAEMIKYAANAFLAMKISFANEIANICERVGADITVVSRGIGLDSRIGSYFLNAGIGWGGSCFGKDVQSLHQIAVEYGYRAPLLEGTLETNRAQRLLVIQKLQEQLLILKGRSIGLLGLAFKPDTDDLRDAPSLQIIERLLQMGARVKLYDPVAMPRCRELYQASRAIQYCESPLQVATDADALVLVTEWNEFRLLNLPTLAKVMRRPLLIDGRNLFDPAAAQEAGFDYTGIGRCCRPQGLARLATGKTTGMGALKSAAATHSDFSLEPRPAL
jgi:UDPglucose 6-dehydrogenase